MTVAELHKELDDLIKQGHGNTDVIAFCDFYIDGVHYEKHMIYLNNIYYQSGDIEIAFSDHEED